MISYIAGYVVRMEEKVHCVECTAGFDDQIKDIRSTCDMEIERMPETAHHLDFSKFARKQKSV